MKRSHNRTGFALLIAMAAVLIASALTLATLFRVQSDSVIARSGTLRRLAAVATESAVWMTVDTANATTLRTLPSGTATRSTITDASSTISVTLTRTDTAFVWIVADVSILRGVLRARHRAAVTVVLPRDTTLTHLMPLPGRAWVESF